MARGQTHHPNPKRQTFVSAGGQPSIGAPYAQREARTDTAPDAKGGAEAPPPCQSPLRAARNYSSEVPPPVPAGVSDPPSIFSASSRVIDPAATCSPPSEATTSASSR